MKKTVAAFVALIIALINCICVANGEIVLSGKLREAEDYAHIGLVEKDAVFVMGIKDLYIWHDGEKDMTAFSLEGLPGRPLAAFKRGGELWMAVYSSYLEKTADLTLVRIEMEDGGRCAVKETVKFGMPVGSILPGEKLDILSAVCAGAKLYMLVDTDYGQTQLWSFDWLTGKASSLREGDLGRRLFEAPGECVLVECQNRDDGAAWYEIFDPQAGSFTPHGGVFDYDKMNDGMMGVAWSPENDVLYYQKDGMLKRAVGFDPGRAEDVTSVTHPTDSMSVCAGLTLKKDYVFLTGEGPVVIDLDDSLKRTVTFKVAMPHSRDAVIKTLVEMEKHHPDVTTAVDSEAYTDQQLVDQMLTCRDDVDVYIVQIDNIFPMMMFLRDYLVEITDPAVRDAVSGMYPEVRKNIELNGKICAVPVSVEGDTIGFDRDVLERLAGDGAELPTDFTALVEKLKELNKKCGDHDEYSIFPIRMTQNSIRTHLLFYILSAYGKPADDDLKMGFNTPELNAALNALLDMDLDEMGVNEESRRSDNALDIRPLISGGASAVCEQLDRRCEPLPLTVFPGRKPVLPVVMKVAIINPYSRKKDLAQEFMAELLQHLDDTTLYTISGDKNTPIPDPEIQERLKDNMDERNELLDMLKDAEGIQREELKVVADSLEETRKELEEKQWKLSQESIDRFRANADKMYVTTYNYTVTGEAADLLRSLLDRRITVEDFTKELDKRTQMAVREGF